jgi:hypothetical protein
MRAVTRMFAEQIAFGVGQRDELNEARVILSMFIAWFAL